MTMTAQSLMAEDPAIAKQISLFAKSITSLVGFCLAVIVDA